MRPEDELPIRVTVGIPWLVVSAWASVSMADMMFLVPGWKGEGGQGQLVVIVMIALAFVPCYVGVTLALRSAYTASRSAMYAGMIAALAAPTLVFGLFALGIFSVR